MNTDQQEPEQTPGEADPGPSELDRALAEAARSLEERQERWEAECQATQGVYPEFDFAQEAADPVFLALVEGGVPVRTAYEAMHLDAVKAAAIREAEKRLTDHILSRGVRPRENGGAAQGAVSVHTDVSRLTRAQRSDIARRAMRGEENITLR